MLTRNQVEGEGRIGTVVQAGQVHGDVHLHPPAPVSAGPPMMLPAPPHRMRDRNAERTRLNRIAAARRHPARPDLLVISGPSGAGTTALALDVAHRAVHAGTAPGGALWADLTPGPASDPTTGQDQDPDREGRNGVDAAVTCWLRVLGAAWIPDRLDQATALLRSLTASRPVVTVIERAATAAQVRALLPATGLVVVTSRLQLPELAADGAQHLDVPPLPEDAAMQLAADLIGTRASEDPDGVRALVAVCNALPGAVIAGATYVAARPHRPITELAERLTQPSPRRTPRSIADEEIIVTTLDTVYNDLPPGHQDAYRSLALMPHPAFTAAAAAALLQLDDEATDTALARLQQANLLEYEHDQWEMPSRVRTHATGLVADLSPDKRTAAVARLTRHWLMWAARLDTLITPGRRRHAAVFGWLPERAPSATGAQDALALMQTWVPTLLAVQAAAAAAGLDGLAWQYAEALWGYVSRRQDYAAWRQVCDVALDSAAHTGDPGALARVHSLTGLLERWLGNLDDAERHHIETKRLAHLAGDTLAEASSAEHHGATLLRMGCPDEAYQVLLAGLTLYQAVPSHPRGEALLRRQLGITWSQLGDHDKAKAEFDTAASVFRTLDEPYPQSQLAVNCAEAAAKAGLVDEALAHLNRAEQILPHKSTAHDAYLQYLRADLHGRAGDHDAAQQALASAIRLADRLPDGHPTTQLIKALVDGRSGAT